MKFHVTIFCTIALSTGYMYGNSLPTLITEYTTASFSAEKDIEKVSTQASKNISKETITNFKALLENVITATLALYSAAQKGDQQAFKQYLAKLPKMFRATDKYTSLLQALYLAQNNIVYAIANKNKQLKVMNELNKKVDQALKMPPVTEIQKTTKPPFPELKIELAIEFGEDE